MRLPRTSNRTPEKKHITTVPYKVNKTTLPYYTITMSVSLQDERLAQFAFAQAVQSPCLHKHGCVAVMNGKVVAGASNSYRLKSHDGYIDEMCSCHAEIAAIRACFYAFKGHKKRHEPDMLIKVV